MRYNVEAEKILIKENNPFEGYSQYKVYLHFRTDDLARYEFVIYPNGAVLLQHQEDKPDQYEYEDRDGVVEDYLCYFDKRLVGKAIAPNKSINLYNYLLKNHTEYKESRFYMSEEGEIRYPTDRIQIRK